MNIFYLRVKNSFNCVLHIRFHKKLNGEKSRLGCNPICQIMTELQPQTGHRYKSSAKVNASVLWLSAGHTELTVKSCDYVAICELCATHSLYSKMHKCIYPLIYIMKFLYIQYVSQSLFIPQKPLLKHLPEHSVFATFCQQSYASFTKWGGYFLFVPSLEDLEFV